MNASCLPLASTKSWSLLEVWLDLNYGSRAWIPGLRLQGLGILAGPFWGWASGPERIGGVSSLILPDGLEIEDFSAESN